VRLKVLRWLILLVLFESLMVPIRLVNEKCVLLLRVLVDIKP